MHCMRCWDSGRGRQNLDSRICQGSTQQPGKHRDDGHPADCKSGDDWADAPPEREGAGHEVLGVQEPNQDGDAVCA